MADDIQSGIEQNLNNPPPQEPSAPPTPGTDVHLGGPQSPGAPPSSTYSEQPTGSGLGAATDTKYAWDKQAEEQAGLKLGVNEEAARMSSMQSAQYLQEQSQQAAVNAALGKYTTAQQVDKYGWAGGGSEWDMNYQLNYMKSSIAADLYNMAELQRLGLESNLATARMQYALDKKTLAMEAYRAEQAFALQEAQTTGRYLSVEARDMLSQLQANDQILAKFGNNPPEEGTLERAEYDRAVRVSEAIDSWFENNGISKAGQQTLAAWQSEWQVWLENYNLYVDKIERNNDTLSAIEGMNNDYQNTLYVAVPGAAGLEMVRADDMTDEQVKAVYWKDGTPNLEKIAADIAKKTMTPDNANALWRKLAGADQSQTIDGFVYGGDRPLLADASLGSASALKVLAANGNNAQEVLNKYGDTSRTYIQGGSTWVYKNGVWQVQTTSGENVSQDAASAQQSSGAFEVVADEAGNQTTVPKAVKPEGIAWNKNGSAIGGLFRADGFSLVIDGDVKRVEVDPNTLDQDGAVVKAVKDLIPNHGDLVYYDGDLYARDKHGKVVRVRGRVNAKDWNEVKEYMLKTYGKAN